MYKFFKFTFTKRSVRFKENKFWSIYGDECIVNFSQRLDLVRRLRYGANLSVSYFLGSSFKNILCNDQSEIDYFCYVSRIF